MANGTSKTERTADAKKGKRLWVQCGFKRTWRMIEDSHILAYIKRQRRRIASKGECDGGCSTTEEIEHYAHGGLVCPYSLEPCAKRKLGTLIETFGELNK